MLKKTIVVGGLVGLVACASSTEGTGSSSGGGACPDITGNYSATAERISGTCDPALDPKGAMSAGVQRSGDGWSIVVPGLEGGCPGTFDEKSCTLSAACEVRDKDGVVLGTSSVSYTFTSTGFAGSNVSGLRPPAVAERCEATYAVSATKL